MPPHDFAVLRTADSGETWTQQLSGSAGQIGKYVHFFDATSGVLVLLGPEPALYQTSDKGSNWSRQALPQAGGYVWSADFIDARHGWLLARVQRKANRCSARPMAAPPGPRWVTR